MKWTRGRKAIFGVIGFGSIIIATVGFVGSYEAVRRLAEEKGFGWFAQVFPLGIDIGIAVLLSLDLALTWIDLKWAPLRYIAWVLTAGTVVFNSAASWPDLLGAAMHGVIPLLFIAVVEAVRNAIAKAAAIEDDQHMESIRLARWFLAPIPTFLLWRKMKLWELRSYEQVILLEQERLVYQARLQARFGRRWRRKAPVEALMPLRLSQYGVPLAETAADGLAAAGIESVPAFVLRRTVLSRPDPGPQQVRREVEMPETALAAEAPRPPREAVAEQEVPPALGQGGDRGVGQRVDEGLVEAEVHEAEDVQAEDGRQGEEIVDAEDAEAAQPDRGAGDAPALDVGTGPPNETKSQKAARIYLAHQKAGVELTRADLARWAGYKQEGSGRTQYTKAEEKYGPIVVREGADQLDLDLQHEDLR
ncbi:DUF2637 domain-containing protein [Streptomyces reticuliscabiei]|uniref:DUF2637 domain-containing protein n=1 Tax=Streptomyces reticuliscabiei TaxID=146821 RepID=UPI001FE77D99|nr:DUF2637 domain-containing protein [Streptomyces reticuliscabiei]